MPFWGIRGSRRSIALLNKPQAVGRKATLHQKICHQAMVSFLQNNLEVKLWKLYMFAL
jgi:hypothetical protein